MTGSGNDFVFFDARGHVGDLESKEIIGALCDRRRGVGADGVVLLEADAEGAYGIRYFNRDGSLAEFCGNASLCSVTLAAELGVVSQGEAYRFRTSSGLISGLLTASGPRVSMPAVQDADPAFESPLAATEARMGYARVGVPHIVVDCADVDAIDVAGRGRELRYLPVLPAGANVNFVSRRGGGWTYRTYERGVEQETLACGSGSVATAAMLRAWGEATDSVRLLTRSGATLEITLGGNDGPRLAGEGRLVYEGRLRDFRPRYALP